MGNRCFAQHDKFHGGFDVREITTVWCNFGGSVLGPECGGVAGERQVLHFVQDDKVIWNDKSIMALAFA